MKINGLEYYVEQHGAGAPLLMLHGFSGSCDTWLPYLELFGRKRRLILIDLPGHGRSESPGAERHAIELVARDLVDLLAACGHAQADVLGYSMGARLALALAVLHPAAVTRLILESGSPGLADPGERARRRLQDNALADQIEQKGVAWFVGHWESLPLWRGQRGLSERMRIAQRAQRLSCNAAGLTGSLRGMGTGVQPSYWQQLPGLTMPVQLITGAFDTKFGAINQRMRDALPQVALNVIPGAGHAAHLEQPEAFARACALPGGPKGRRKRGS